ncbi:IS3 family transposase [Spiroplasma endosymbiont of Panzeria rudis]|uniref:IS3 family transposase n=1 Tax=Spiroplasma endosymbiont of Panzeria rudis TaxID=3066301 RepID=UPI003BB0FF5D
MIIYFIFYLKKIKLYPHLKYVQFINDKNFTSLIQLKLELFNYINWYNNIRIHSTLNYLTPVNYQK